MGVSLLSWVYGVPTGALGALESVCREGERVWGGTFAVEFWSSRKAKGGVRVPCRSNDPLCTQNKPLCYSNHWPCLAPLRAVQTLLK